MRYPTMLVAALVTPASAAAHSGPHDGMGPFEILVHLAGQHFAPLLAVAFITALLHFAGFRLLHRTGLVQDNGIHGKKRQG